MPKNAGRLEVSACISCPTTIVPGAEFASGICAASVAAVNRIACARLHHCIRMPAFLASKYGLFYP
jgi:hypothetical protein